MLFSIGWRDNCQAGWLELIDTLRFEIETSNTFEKPFTSPFRQSKMDIHF